MKTMKKLMLFLMLGALVVNTSCKKDDATAAPTLSVIADKSEGKPGDVISFNITASTTATLKNLNIKEKVTGSSGSVQLKDSTISGTSLGYTYKYTIPAGATGTKDLVFTVTDNGSLTNTVTKTTTITATATYSEWTAVLVGAQSNTTKGSFVNTADGLIYLVADAKTNAAKVDFCYYYGATKMATIASPDDASVAGGTTGIDYGTSGPQSWTPRNHTAFKTPASGVTYASLLTPADLMTAYNAGGAEMALASSLAVGSNVCFKTAGGKYGVFTVTALNPVATGDMTIKVKVQK